MLTILAQVDWDRSLTAATVLPQVRILVQLRQIHQPARVLMTNHRSQKARLLARAQKQQGDHLDFSEATVGHRGGKRHQNFLKFLLKQHKFKTRQKIRQITTMMLTIQIIAKDPHLVILQKVKIQAVFLKMALTDMDLPQIPIVLLI